MAYSKETSKALKRLQQDEINAYYIYLKLSGMIREVDNAAVLERIANEEKKHFEVFSGYLNHSVKPSRGYVVWFVFLARILGLTFALKLMEKKEATVEVYEKAMEEIPEIRQIIDDEERHEGELLDMLDEERLSYMGSVVLGLNDALVELTGALAGFTLSIQNSRTIAIVGLITGISASLSMAASEYLSSRTEADGEVNPKKAAIYTGIAYVFTVIMLILPFFLIANYILSLAVTLLIAILIIAFFNYYISVANDQPFFARFGEMTLISLGVALVSFGIGFLVNKFFGLDI